MPRVVIAGTAQLKYRSSGIEDAREPIDLMEEAARAALADAGSTDAVLKALDRVVVIRSDSWRYDADVGDRLAQRLGARNAGGLSTKHGGDQPLLQVDLAARLIARGQIRAALVCGGEAYASRRQYSKAGITPAWTASIWGVQEPGLEAARRSLGNFDPPRSTARRELGESERHGLVSPIRMYPLYENALKAALGLTFAENQAWSGRIYSKLSVVAATHPAAWNPCTRSAEQITTVSAQNRMICFPYPLLMNAYQGVDQAAAVLVMSEELARDIGTTPGPYVWAGAGCHDSDEVALRVRFDRSAAMQGALQGVLEATKLDVEEIAHLDLYSCFPVVPKLASQILGIDEKRPITVTGGLSSFGGPGNSYALHSLASMTRRIREEGAKSSGLVFAQGHYVTGHHALVLAAAPPPADWLSIADDSKRQEELDGCSRPAIARLPAGAARIETFTAEYHRSGSPAKGWIIGRTPEGHRFVAAATDSETLLRLVSETSEPVGAAVEVAAAPDGTNCFRFA